MNFSRNLYFAINIARDWTTVLIEEKKGKNKNNVIGRDLAWEEEHSRKINNATLMLSLEKSFVVFCQKKINPPLIH